MTGATTLAVVKVGGSLFDWPELPGRLAACLEARRANDPDEAIGLDRRRRSCGGLDPLARSDSPTRRRSRPPTGAARARLDGGRPGETVAGLDRGRSARNARGRVRIRRAIPILAPRHGVWHEIERQGADPLPASWDVTSDTIAARIAVHLGARSLVLIKSASAPRARRAKTPRGLGLVDPMLPSCARSIPQSRIVNLRSDPTRSPSSCCHDHRRLVCRDVYAEKFVRRKSSREICHALCMSDRSRVSAGIRDRRLRASRSRPPTGRGWGMTPGCMRYSELDQINRENVKRLKPVWTFHTRGARRPRRQDDRVHADRDRRRDVRDDRISSRGGSRRGDRQTSSGSSIPCGITRSRTVWRRAGSIEAVRTGRIASPVASGGSFTAHRTDDCFRSTPRPASSTRSSRAGGICNLREGLDPKVAALDYGPTSAPAIWNDTIIVGVSCGEGPGIAAPGDIRAFDVHTGQGSLAFSDRSGARRIRERDVERRLVEGPRRGQRLGRIQRRRHVAAWSSPAWGRPPSTSTAATATAIICLRTARSRSTPGPASASGTSRRCGTTCGTTICRSIRTS